MASDTAPTVPGEVCPRGGIQSQIPREEELFSMSRQKPGAGQEQQARKGRNEGKKLSSHRGAQQNGRCSHSRCPPKTPPKLPFRFGDLPKNPRRRRMTSLRDAAVSSSSHGLCSPNRRVTAQLLPPCPGCVGAMCVYVCVLTLSGPEPRSAVPAHTCAGEHPGGPATHRQ